MQEEEFEIFEEEYPYKSKNILEKRSIVHKTGLIHKSVNLFIIAKDKTKILVQKRSPHKDICPNCWDLSCAEHLKPKESFAEGIIRGCMEELNITSITSSQLQLVRDATLQKAHYKNGTIKDYEVTCLFMLELDDEIELQLQHLDRFIPNDEVAQIEWRSISQISTDIHSQQHPHNYTDWFIDAFSYFYDKVYQQRWCQ